MFSVYGIYPTGAMVELRQFKTKQQAVEYAEMAAAKEPEKDATESRLAFAVCKVERLATYGGPTK